MSLLLELPPDLERDLAARAAGLVGTKPEIADASEPARMLHREAERRTR